MKLIALTLLLLNLAYLGYHFSQEEAAPKRSSSANQQSANIQLLSEREGGDEFDGAAVNAVENPIRSEVAVDQTSAVCFAIGPFEDVFSGQDALERINAIQVEGELRAIDVATGESDYQYLYRLQGPLRRRLGSSENCKPVMLIVTSLRRASRRWASL